MISKILTITAMMFIAIATSANGAEKQLYPSQGCILCIAESSVLDILKLSDQEEDDKVLQEAIKKLLKNRDCLMANQETPFIMIETSSQNPEVVAVSPKGYNVPFWTLRGSLLDTPVTGSGK